jgi:hypothetical protein
MFRHKWRRIGVSDWFQLYRLIFLHDHVTVLMMLDHEREVYTPSKTKVMTHNMREVQLLRTFPTAV